MNYLLTQQEYDDLRREKQSRTDKQKDELQALCTLAAQHIPVVLEWSHDKTPRPWGCILGPQDQDPGYCDKCPAADVCPQSSEMECTMTDATPNDTPTPERKMAPVQGWPQGIPWSLHLEAYSAYSKKWAPQKALIEGWCRGGFSTDELDEFIPGWRERASESAARRPPHQTPRTE